MNIHCVKVLLFPSFALSPSIHPGMTESWLPLPQKEAVPNFFCPEIKVFFMLFDRSLSIFSMTSLKQHIEYCTSKFVVKSGWASL